MEKCAADGATYGDFQFHIDNKSPHFLKAGILSTYTPVDNLEDFPKNEQFDDESRLSSE